jgi:hypothetical protein
VRCEFEEPIIRDRVRAAADWLCRSQDVTGCGGSSASYSPLFGWALPYPETTGYIIPTLWKSADVCGNDRYSIRAERMARWLVEIQLPDGSFPGGTWSPNSRSSSSVFNTGQILFGLLEAADRTSESSFQDSASRAVNWLVHEQHESGRWHTGNYRKGYSPSYYAHVCWPLAIYWRRCGGDDVRRCIERALDAILSDRTAASTYRSWGFFAPDKPAFTHTIAYTLCGLIESALLLNQWDPYGVAAADTCERLMRRFEIRGKLAGAYSIHWEPTEWFVCLTGNCQIALAWLRLFKTEGDARFLNAALKAVGEVCRRQRLCPRRQNVHGAISGSYPLVGRYMAMRYPNWAAKFYIDALLGIGAALQSLSFPTYSTVS